uniref:DUF3726 domain-containing protein n=1 Tax=uncultured Thiotrichaceae bacterium TaxID=298394 RepID=A0A6S6TX92_9GAMM|nr:MAG: Unknown protein [uncultured Thiotrichaceae bacterium]
MIYSLSEIDTHVKKAARGAGFDWGCAEEAGKGARLLAAYQLPGMRVVTNYLEQKVERPSVFQSPKRVLRHWQPQTDDGMLCPLLTGECLSDPGPDACLDTLVLQDVAAPLLLLPSVFLLTREYGHTLELRWRGVHLVCHAGYLDVQENVALDADHVDQCSIRNAQGAAAGNLGRDVDSAIWGRLDRLAKLTYVAATEASRAGAGPAE